MVVDGAYYPPFDPVDSGLKLVTLIMPKITKIKILCPIEPDTIQIIAPNRISKKALKPFIPILLRPTNISNRHFNPIPLSIKAPNLIKKSLFFTRFLFEFNVVSLTF